MRVWFQQLFTVRAKIRIRWIDPLGEAVLDAVRNDRFWILTHDEAKPGVVQRAEDIVNGVNPTVGPGFG